MSAIRTGPETRELIRVQYLERWKREAESLLSLLAIAMDPLEEWVEIEMKLNQGIVLANFLASQYFYETRFYDSLGNKNLDDFEWYLYEEDLSHMNNDFDKLMFLLERVHQMIFDHADPNSSCRLLINVPL